MTLPAQSTRLLRIVTAAGEGAVTAVALGGQEAVSALFRFEVEVVSPTSLSGDTLLGQPAVATVTREAGEAAHFHGIVQEIDFTGHQADGSGQELYRYTLTLVPRLWLLAQGRDCRIFQNRSVPDIIEEVLASHQFADYRLDLQRQYRRRDYCVQYRESSFAFLSRLMEEEGIFYYFVHGAGRHTVVFADGATTPPEATPATLRYLMADVAGAEDSIEDWTESVSLQPAAIATTDFNQEKPLSPLGVQTSIRGAPPGATDIEVFQYPGRYPERDDGETLARLQAEHFEANRRIAAGRSNAPGLRAGHAFALAGHPASGLDGRFVVAEAYHAAQNDLAGGGAGYSNRFRCTDAAHVPRPPRVTPRPQVEGPQTATVVGPKGEEIHTDRQGRVKLRFHWDRRAKNESGDSCWVRVAQSAAGNGWGFQWIPRIGMEVLVEFLDGDPDRPLVTGVVYNGINRTPYDLPGQATVSSLKTMSSPGGGGFNELAFEDKKGEEQVFLHAQKRLDLRVRGEQRESIGGSSHTGIAGARRIRIGDDDHLTVKGDSAAAIEGAMSLSVREDSDIRLQGEAVLGVGGELVITAGSAITLQVAGSTVRIDASGVVIRGPLVRINSGGGGFARQPSPKDPELPAAAAERRAGEAARQAPAPRLAGLSATRSTSTQAAALRAAATSGTPLVRHCADA
ncbi:MAG: type VI secretion system tip protein VgrG [Roseomonas sp.]|nr:type VI secretion system tip protein VgrG [Roseomonas sp.]